ncbi:IS66 family transposase, partial [Sulfurimonas sp. MAG313]
MYYIYNVLQKDSDTVEKVEILKKDYEKLVFERDEFKRQLEELKRMIFGSKSERYAPVDESQLSLFEQLKKEEEKIEKQLITYQREVSNKKKKKPVRTQIPSHLRRVEEIIEPDNIAEGSVKIGEEITELLEATPSTIFVRKIIRPKYALPRQEGIVIAELPSLPIPKGNAGASMLSFITVSKFVDHLPLYRLRQIFKRQDVDISPSTISGWSGQTASLLSPLYDSFKKDFLADTDYLQADESPIKVQDRDKKKALHQGYMWAYRNPVKRMVLFEYNKGRGKVVPEKFFENFNGTLQTDGYKVYQSFTTKGKITLLGCMAHARRYFEKALDNDPVRSQHVLLLIQRLYKMERKVKERNSSIDVIKRYRLIYAAPILKELKEYLMEQQYIVLPKSSIGIAIAYTLRIFNNLSQYI